MAGFENLGDLIRRDGRRGAGYAEPRLSRSIAAPPPANEGRGGPRTVADAANYIVALPEERRRTHWDRTVQLLLDMADLSEISRQLELALLTHINIAVPAGRAWRSA